MAVSGRGALRAIVFDKDGTLFDFQGTWGPWAAAVIGAESGGDGEVAALLAERLGVDPEAGRVRPGSPVVAATTGEIAGWIAPVLGAEPSALEARLNARSRSLVPVEAAPLRPLLGRLRAMGLRLGVATNDAEAPARAHLAGVLDLLDFVAGYDSGWGGKPGAGQLLAFARAVGVEAGGCAMVGDSLHDLHAGRAAGMRTVGVLTGVAGREELEAHADAVLDSVAGLPAWAASLVATRPVAAGPSRGGRPA